MLFRSALCGKLGQKLAPHSQTCCMGGPRGVSLQQKITPSEVTSCHGEGNLDGAQVQLGVTGTCKAEAGQHLRTSLAWQQAAVGRLCSERRRLGPRPCLRCMLVCSLGQRWGACPPTCSQSCPALEGTPAPISAPIRGWKSQPGSPRPAASQLRRPGPWPQPVVGQPHPMPGSSSIACSSGHLPRPSAADDLQKCPELHTFGGVTTVLLESRTGKTVPREVTDW